MGIWDAIMIVAVVGIVAELVKFLVKTRAKAKNVGKDGLVKLHDAISSMQTDLDEIKANLRTVVIQMDDLSYTKQDSLIADKKD